MHGRKTIAGAGRPPDKPEDRERESRDLQELMERYQAGEMEAFDQLYAQLAPPIRGWLRRRRRDPGADVDDLVQETFLQIHRSRHTYTPGRPVEPWAWAIARNVHRMALRRRGRKEGRETELRDAGVGDAEGSFLERDRVGRALSGTTGRRRKAVVLHHLLGYSFREIGSLLGIRADTAKRQASRGVADLRRDLGKDRSPESLPESSKGPASSESSGDREEPE